MVPRGFWVCVIGIRKQRVSPCRRHRWVLDRCHICDRTASHSTKDSSLCCPWPHIGSRPALCHTEHRQNALHATLDSSPWWSQSRISAVQTVHNARRLISDQQSSFPADISKCTRWFIKNVANYNPCGNIKTTYVLASMNMSNME